jgi:hypothetical protein
MKRLVPCLSVLLLTACGSGGGGEVSTDAVTAADAEAYCRADCERCPSDDGVDACTSECVSSVAGWMREDALAAIVECRSEVACQGDDSSCAASFDPLPVHEAYEAACRQALGECLDPVELELCESTPGQGESFVALIAPPIVEEMTACFGTSCQADFECLLAVLDEHGVDL